MNRLKQQIHEVINDNKNRNNNYWLKIKGALGKIHDKLGSLDKKLNKIGHYLQNEKAKRQANSSVISQLQKAPAIASNLAQIQNSTNSLYQSYQQVV